MTPNPNLKSIHDAGVSIWLDTLSRELLQSGEFEALARDYSVTGATSNPTIFAKAITSSNLYDEELRQLASAGERNPQELFLSIALEDDLWRRLSEPNVMIKVPGTEAGLPAIEELTRHGTNINVTLLFRSSATSR